MYEIFSKLLETRGVKAADVCRGTGLPSSLFSEWKRGKSTPKADKMKKIADYFGITVDYLMTGEKSKDYTTELSAVETLAAHFDGEELSEEEMEEIMSYVEFVKSRRKK
ncbi:helix-turn-helix transcriptional regulator [Clostridium sp. E02]|uniref:helix-turn-helix domain-containing protein n=1 Tax=Clostridium sp. E02 TaxID=2487134 RepID=UPI000F52D5ED|nr:helix-turn-helix transcriptional regulator [Clostridium sp. E02]